MVLLVRLEFGCLIDCDSIVCFFFFKHKTAYEMRISDWSSDVCSSDLQCDQALSRRIILTATNIILGYGETLTSNHELKRASGDKKYPYQIREQRAWLGGQLESLQQVRAMIPAEAKPRGESVAKFTLHPTFLAKSHHPNGWRTACGRSCIGSRSTYIGTRRVNKAGMSRTEPIYTAVLYVTGVDESFSRLSSMLLSPNTATTHQKALCRFESIQPFAAQV